MLIYLQDWNSPFLRSWKVKCIKPSPWLRHKILKAMSPDLGHSKGRQKKNPGDENSSSGKEDFWNEEAWGSIYISWIITSSLPCSDPFLKSVWTHACTACWASPGPLNSGRWEGKPVHLTNSSQSLVERGLQPFKRIGSSFVGVGKGIKRARESPPQSHSREWQTLLWCWRSSLKMMCDDSKLSGNPSDI